EARGRTTLRREAPAESDPSLTIHDAGTRDRAHFGPVADCNLLSGGGTSLRRTRVSAFNSLMCRESIGNCLLEEPSQRSGSAPSHCSVNVFQAITGIAKCGIGSAS